LTTLGGGVAVVESESGVVDRQLAQAVLDQLAVRDRRALWESHVEERPVGEIAERLGLNYLATAQLLHRARRRAAIVAAELAALLALIRLGMRRARMQIQNLAPVASVVTVPVVMAALVVVTPRPSTETVVAQVHPSPRPTIAANPTQIPPAATNPSTGLPPPAPSATPATIQQSVPVAVAALPSPPAPIVVSLPKPVVKPLPKPTGPPWKKGQHKLGNHGHGHSAS
jgi:hypothetical protein